MSISFASIQYRIAGLFEMNDEDLDAEQRQLLEDLLSELANLEEDKVDGIATFLRAEKARAAFKREEAKRLTNEARNIEAKLDRFCDYCLHVMQGNGLKKVSGKAYSMSIRSFPIVHVENEQLVPKDFWKTKTETSLDKTAIRDALKAGAVVPGCSMGKSYSLQTA